MTRNSNIKSFISQDHIVILKIGGDVIQHELENLISSIVLLNQVGFKLVILHGASTMLSSALKNKKIEFSFIDGQRVTSSKIRDIAVDVFSNTNKIIVDLLNNSGLNVKGLTKNIFSCEFSHRNLGYVGKIQSINQELIRSALNIGSIPVIASIGYHANEALNINADSATIELAKVIKPYKLVFLTEIGGIFNDFNELIPDINLALDYEDLLLQSWIHSGMRYKLERINDIFNSVPLTSSVLITKPSNLEMEAFIRSNSGTVIRCSHAVERYTSFDPEFRQLFKNIIDSAFNGHLVNNYFERNDRLNIFMTICKQATIAISEEYPIPYMDKFAVVPEAQGHGVGARLFDEMINVYPKLFWRSRSDNPSNDFYLSLCQGYHKQNDWHIFWIGIFNDIEITDCINYAINKPISVVRYDD